MTAYIIYNGFWNATPPDPVVRLHTAFGQQKIASRMLPNTELTACLGNGVSLVLPDGVSLSPEDILLFWDKDTRLAFSAESAGLRVYNTAAAVARCDDKSETHRILAAAGIPMPETLVAPMTYTQITKPIKAFLDTAERTLGYPMVFKECYGSFGKQVFLVHNRKEFEELAYTRESRPFLVQHFVEETAGEDIRLYVVGDRVAASMKRHSSSDFRANIGQGGTAEPYTPTAEEEELALKCCRLLGLCFGGVDILQSKNGPLMCEVNSNAHMAGIIACTGVDIAEEIVSEVLRCETERNTIWSN